MAFPGKLYREGTILKQENVSGNPRIVFVEQFGFNHFLNDDIFRWIDILAENGVNGMRVFGFWPFAKGREESPYVKVGNSYDLTRFNEPFFEYLQRWIAHADDKGIVVLYELFDSCGFWYAPAAPYNPFYQLVGIDHKRFSDLNNAYLLDIQRKYIRKVIDTVRPHVNLIFGIMNEFQGDARWYREMTRYVKSLAPDCLIAGSEEGSPAADDPAADIWFIHRGSYDLNSGHSDVSGDVRDMRQQTGPDASIGFSTDGFGMSGMPRENPTDMSRLARDVGTNGLQLFGFLDHKAYIADEARGSIGQLNVETYRAIVEAFPPHPAPLRAKFRFDESSYASLAKKNVPAGIITKLQDLKGQEFLNETALLNAVESVLGRAPTAQYKDLIIQYTDIDRPVEGFLDIFRVATLPSTHPGAFVERGGKAIHATTEQGFLCYGQYKKNYPQKPLKALFSIFIDNNTADDRNILILDVYDHHSDRVIGKEVITRKDFKKVNEFCVFEFDFTPPSDNANMEFRIFYMGWAYILADKIAVIDPAEVTITDASQIPDSLKASGSPSSSSSEDDNNAELEGELVLFDPLTDGKSVASTVNGGQFTPDGYRVETNFHGYLVYETDIVGNIGLEFDAKGYIDREDCSDSKLVVLLMFDSPRDANWGDPAIWRDSHYSLLEVRKRGIVPGFDHVTNGLGLKCGAHGHGLEFGTWAGHGQAGHPIEWHPDTVYHWVITWRDGVCDIRRNGQAMYSVNTTPQYAPTGKMNIRIGGTHWGRGGPRNVTYSNVRIYRL